jgi:hypothetical protein
MGNTIKKDWTKVANSERRLYQFERNPNVKKRNQKERFDGKEEEYDGRLD